jgi:hypothetical protein
VNTGAGDPASFQTSGTLRIAANELVLAVWLIRRYRLRVHLTITNFVVLLAG